VVESAYIYFIARISRPVGLHCSPGAAAATRHAFLSSSCALLHRHRRAVDSGDLWFVHGPSLNPTMHAGGAAGKDKHIVFVRHGVIR